MSVPRRRFHEVARHRPITLVAAPAEPPYVAPSAAIEVDLAGRGPVELRFTGRDGRRLAARYDGHRVSLALTDAEGRPTEHRSRRHGRARRPAGFALTLTGRHLTALTRERGRWVARGRVELGAAVPTDRPDATRRPCFTHDPDWLAGLAGDWVADPGVVRTGRSGPFGQLGLRDLRLVTHADGTAYRIHRGVLLSATSAGPGFFDTAHTSLWHLDTTTLALTHRSDLWFTRPDRPGVYGDHASHVVRDDDRWLVATSTWGDFTLPSSRRRRAARHHPGKPWVDVTLAETEAELTTGTHVLPTRPLPLPTDGLASVGVWDPHLVRSPEGWQVGYVSAREYFRFHPVLAAGPTLTDLRLLGAAADRRETEGTTLLRTRDGVRLLASDGPANPRRIRRRYPVFDEALRERETLDAPYLSNIGWPTLVPPGPDQTDWLLVTFDGTPAGGRLTGYGTHGDVVVLSPPSP